MSADVIQFVSANRSKLSLQLVLQCAPVLSGVKVSNILIVDDRYKKAVGKLLQGTGISIHILYELDGRIAFLLYRRNELLAALEEEAVQEFFRNLGYEGDQLEVILARISEEYTQYMIDKESFPHELGLILGYPVEDVTGFMEHKGKNYRYSGYWKVYGDVHRAKSMFAQYEQAKEELVGMVSRGMGISRILNIYETQEKTSGRVAI